MIILILVCMYLHMLYMCHVDLLVHRQRARQIAFSNRRNRRRCGPPMRAPKSQTHGDEGFCDDTFTVKNDDDRLSEAEGRGGGKSVKIQTYSEMCRERKSWGRRT